MTYINENGEQTCRANRKFYYLLIIVVALFAAIGIRWIWLFRYQQPLDIDESGYLAFAFADYYGAVRGGWQGLISAVDMGGFQAPLTGLFAASIFFATGPSVVVAFAAPLLAGVGTIVATFFLSATLGSLGSAIVSAVMVASCPIIIAYSRSFHFALPATFFTTMALLALLRSRRFDRIGWTALFGLSLGLMPLARTMTLGFVPGIVLAAFLYVIVDPLNRFKRLVLFCASLLLALGFAAIWLVPSAHAVFGYLWTYGYGSRAAEYGPANGLFSVTGWLVTLQIFIANLYLPHILVLSVGAILLTAAVAKQLSERGLTAFRDISRSNVLPMVVFIGEALVALTSTQNKGSAFIAPMVPAVIVLAVWAAEKVVRGTIGRRVGAAVAGLAMILAAVPSADLRLSRIWSVDLPVLGLSTVTDGRGTIQDYEAAGGYSSIDPSEPVSVVDGGGWQRVSEATAARIQQAGGAPQQSASATISTT